MKLILVLCLVVSATAQYPPPSFSGYGGSNGGGGGGGGGSDFSLPAVSGDLGGGVNALFELDADVSDPDIDVGDLGDPFNQRQEQGDATEDGGNVEFGEPSIVEGGVTLGQPVPRLLSFTITRNHERIFPVVMRRYKKIPVVERRTRTIPITVRSYRRQPITIKTVHVVRQKPTYSPEPVSTGYGPPPASSGGYQFY